MGCIGTLPHTEGRRAWAAHVVPLAYSSVSTSLPLPALAHTAAAHVTPCSKART